MPDRLLDTNAVSAAMKAEPALERYLKRLGRNEGLVTSVIVEGEIGFGINRLPRGRRQEALRSAFAQVLRSLDEVLLLGKETAAHYARAKSKLWASGRCLGENDLWIAATALTHDLTLVTNDQGFLHVDGLHVEDWSSTG